MKCPECGQWNRASMPHCIRCGMPLNIDAASRVEWKKNLRDDQRSAAYLRADEFGLVEDVQDARDALAREMQDLKKRKQEGIELQQRLREYAAGHTSGIQIESETAAPASRSGAQANRISMKRISAEAEASRRESEARHRSALWMRPAPMWKPASTTPSMPTAPRARIRSRPAL